MCSSSLDLSHQHKRCLTKISFFSQLSIHDRIISSSSSSSSSTRTLTCNSTVSESTPTFGVEIGTRDIEIGGKQIKIQIWDTVCCLLRVDVVIATNCCVCTRVDQKNTDTTTMHYFSFTLSLNLSHIRTHHEQKTL